MIFNLDLEARKWAEVLALMDSNKLNKFNKGVKERIEIIKNHQDKLWQKHGYLTSKIRQNSDIIKFFQIYLDSIKRLEFRIYINYIKTGEIK